MTRQSTMHSLVFLGLILCGLVGCTGSTPPARFYLLGTLPQTEAASPEASSAGPSLLVGPITLAAYLDRSQLMVREGTVGLGVNEFERWAEPLSDSFYRVLQENLSVLLNTADITTYLQQNPAPPDLQVVIHVSRFDLDPEGRARLVAFWSLDSGRDGKRLLGKKTVLTVPAASPAFKDRALAQNEALTEFSREIAAAVAELANPRP